MHYFLLLNLSSFIQIIQVIFDYLFLYCIIFIIPVIVDYMHYQCHYILYILLCVASQSPSIMDSPLQSIPFTEGMGIREDDILLGADEDSPQLNVEAVAQAEWRLRLYLYELLR